MRALPLAHLVGYDAADPDDRDHQPVRERPLIQLDAEARSIATRNVPAGLA